MILGKPTTRNTGAVGTPQPAPAAQPTLSPVDETLASLLTSPNWQSQVAGYLGGQAASTIAGSALSNAIGSANLAMTGPQLATGQAEAGVNQQYQLAQALLGYEGTELQSQGLASQAATAGQQQGLEEAQYGVQQGQYPQQMQQAALANENAVKALQRQGAIGGTTVTTGHKEAQATQGAEYGWQQADIFRAQQLAQLGQQSERVGYQGQQEQIANQRRQLELAAQGEGISTQQAQAQFGFGLQQLGVQATPEQYISQIMGAQGAGAQAQAGVGSQAALIGGLGPNFLGNIG